MNRSKRRTTAKQTLRIIEEGGYQPPLGPRVSIVKAVNHAVASTRLYTPDELARLHDQPPITLAGKTWITVANETTLAAASRLVNEDSVGGVLCLNFASAKNPGGGFLGGSQAQEESLARSSALYPSLMAAREYYDTNRACGTAMYTDHMILSPGVPVFRDDNGELLDAPYAVTFITAPAVNAGAVTRNQPDAIDQIIPTMRRRVSLMLALAQGAGCRHLVLGAWGCGVFRNEPADMAALFAEQLIPYGRYSESFEHVHFAVLDRPGGGIYNAFAEVFGKAAV